MNFFLYRLNHGSAYGAHKMMRSRERHVSCSIGSWNQISEHGGVVSVKIPIMDIPCPLWNIVHGGSEGGSIYLGTVAAN